MTKPLFSILFVFLVALTTSAEDKKPDPIDAKLLIGKWETKDDMGGVCFIEYKKGGKMTVTLPHPDRGDFRLDTTYTLDGNKLTTVQKLGDRDEPMVWTVVKLTETELVVRDEKGKGGTLVRLKDKK